MASHHHHHHYHHHQQQQQQREASSEVAYTFQLDWYLAWVSAWLTDWVSLNIAVKPSCFESTFRYSLVRSGINPFTDKRIRPTGQEKNNFERNIMAFTPARWESGNIWRKLNSFNHFNVNGPNSPNLNSLDSSQQVFFIQIQIISSSYLRVNLKIY